MPAVLPPSVRPSLVRFAWMLQPMKMLTLELRLSVMPERAPGIAPHTRAPHRVVAWRDVAWRTGGHGTEARPSRIPCKTTCRPERLRMNCET